MEQSHILAIVKVDTSDTSLPSTPSSAPWRTFDRRSFSFPTSAAGGQVGDHDEGDSGQGFGQASGQASGQEGEHDESRDAQGAVETCPPAAAGMLVLEDRSEYLLYEGPNVVGSSSDATVRIQDVNTSSQHACIFIDGRSGRVEVEDLGSRWGTRVNTVRLSPYRSVSVYHLDQLIFGNIHSQYFSVEEQLN